MSLKYLPLLTAIILTMGVSLRVKPVIAYEPLEFCSLKASLPVNSHPKKPPFTGKPSDRKPAGTHIHDH